MKSTISVLVLLVLLATSVYTLSVREETELEAEEDSVAVVVQPDAKLAAEASVARKKWDAEVAKYEILVAKLTADVERTHAVRDKATKDLQATKAAYVAAVKVNLHQKNAATEAAKETTSASFREAVSAHKAAVDDHTAAVLALKNARFAFASAQIKLSAAQVAEDKYTSPGRREALANEASRHASVNRRIADTQAQRAEAALKASTARADARALQLKQAEAAYKSSPSKGNKQTVAAATLHFQRAQQRLANDKKHHAQALHLLELATAKANKAFRKHQQAQRRLRPDAPVYVGCFEEQTNNRAVPTLQGKVGSIFETGKFVSPVEQCAQMARKADHLIFALQNGNQCWSSAQGDSYGKHGRESNLKLCGPNGGLNTNQVYSLAAEF